MATIDIAEDPKIVQDLVKEFGFTHFVTDQFCSGWLHLFKPQACESCGQSTRGFTGKTKAK